MKIKKIAFLLGVSFILLGVLFGYNHYQNSIVFNNENVNMASTQEEKASYTVTKYLPKLDGTGYEEVSKTYEGIVGETVSYAFETVIGFSGDTDNQSNVLSGTILDDDSLHIKMYYVRKTFVVNLKNSTRDFGSLKLEDGTTVTTVNLLFGESIYVDGETLVVGKNRIVATPKDKDAQYEYYFCYWDLSSLSLNSDGKFVVENEFTRSFNVGCSFDRKVREYKVVWMNENQEIYSEFVKYGETPTYKGETPLKKKDVQYSYTFNGWNPKINTVTEEVTYVAQYSKTLNNYTVTFEVIDGTANYGKVSLTSQSLIVPYGTKIQISSKDPNTIIVGNTSILAIPSNNTARYEHRFEAWINEYEEVTQDITIGVRFTRIEKVFTVLWIDGKTVLETDSSLTYGTIPSYDGATPYRPANGEYTYNFIGWSPTISAVTKDISYYAQYEQTINCYKVTWEVENQVVEIDEKVPYGTMPSYDGETPTKKGGSNYYFVFEGWYKDVEPVSADVIYTAVFSRWYTTNTVGNESRVVINSSGLRTDIIFEVEEIKENRTFILPKDMEAVLLFKASLKRENIDYVSEEGVQVVVDLKDKFHENRIYHVYMNIDGEIIEPTVTMDGSKVCFNTNQIGSFIIYTEIVKEVKLIWLTITFAVLIVAEAAIFYFIIVKKYRQYKRQIELSKVNSNVIIPTLLVIRYVTAGNLVPAILVGVLFLMATGFIIYCFIKIKQMKDSIPSEEDDFIYIPTHDEEDSDIETCPVYTGPKRDTSSQRKQTYYDTPYRPIYYYQPIPVYQQGNVEYDDENDDEIIIEDGEIVRIHYKRSFMSRIIQGSKEIQDYYTRLRNEIAAYSRLKSRVGWEHESIYTSRETIVLIKVKGDMLCVFLALDPSKFNKGKINFGDVGKIKKYKNVPMLIKVQTEKDLDDVIKLIDQICKKNKLNKDELGNEDYHYEFRTDKELIEEGLIKEVRTYSKPAEEIEEDILTEDMIRSEINVTEAKEALTDEQALSLIETVESTEKQVGNKKTIVNIGTLSRFYSANEIVNLETLKNKKIVSKDTGYVKILASGVLDKPLTVEANSYSIDAVKMILLTGGKVIKI